MSLKPDYNRGPAPWANLRAMGYIIPTWWHCRCKACVQQRQDKEDELRADI